MPIHRTSLATCLAAASLVFAWIPQAFAAGPALSRDTADLPANPRAGSYPGADRLELLPASRLWPRPDTPSVQPSAVSPAAQPLTSAPEYSSRDQVTLSGKLLRRYLPFSVADLLTQAPGVDLQCRGPWGIQNDISLRGATFQQSLVLLDQQPWRDPQTAHHNLNLPVTVDEIEGLEILPGHGSSRFGSQAMGGTLAVATFPPGQGQARLTAWGGGFGTLGARLFLPVATAAGGHSLAFEQGATQGYRPGTDAQWLRAGYHGDLPLAAPAQIRLGFADERFGAADFYAPYPSREHTRLWYSSLRTSSRLSPAVELEPLLSFRRHEDFFQLDSTQPQAAVNSHRNWTLQGELPLLWSFPAGQRLRLGLSGRRENLESSVLGGRQRTLTGLYAFYQSAAAADWFYDLSLRADAEGLQNFTWSPAAGLALGLTPDWKIRASAGHAFRRPDFTELYYSSPANRGNPQLQPEKAWCYEIGADGRLGQIAALGLTGFYRRAYDVIDWTRRSAAEPWTANNLSRVSAAGGSVHAGVSVLGLIFQFAGGYQEVVLQAPAADASKYQLHAPRWYLQAAATLESEGVLTPDVRATCLQRPNQPATWLLDAGVLFALSDRWRLFAKGSNLLDVRYEDIPGVPMPGLWLAGGVAWILE